MTLIAAEQLANQTPTGFWAAVGLAAAIATALSTAASTAAAIWWRYQDRKEAEWSARVLTRGGTDINGNRVAAPKVAVLLQNIGDGSAHQVRVSGSLLARDPWVGQSERGPNGLRGDVHQPIPMLHTGDAIFVSIEANSFEVWEDAEIVISWWPPPTRKKKDWGIRSREQRQRFKLGELTPVPTDLSQPRQR